MIYDDNLCVLTNKNMISNGSSVICVEQHNSEYLFRIIAFFGKHRQSDTLKVK